MGYWSWPSVASWPASYGLWRLYGPNLCHALVGPAWAGVPLVWTNPPYGVDYASKNAYLNKADRGNRVQRPIENDNLTPEQTSQLFKAALGIAIPDASPGPPATPQFRRVHCLSISFTPLTHRL
jgi:hypothetical protein